MLKKIMYAILSLLIGVFIYNTYFKEEEIVTVNMNNDMRMLDVVYVKDGYRVEADEQNDKKEEKKIYFDKAKSYFEKTFIKSNLGIYHEELSDLLLKGDVYGINKDNSWEIEGDELKYIGNRELFYTDKGIKAYNKERALTILGDYFESDTDMNNLKLEKNVNAYTESYDLKSDKALYSEITGILNLEGNVRVLVKEQERDGRSWSEVKGFFPRAQFDTNTQILTSMGNYEVHYQGYVLRGKRLTYNERTGIMNASGDLSVVKGDLYLEFEEAILDQNTNLLTLLGPVRGDNLNQNLEADNGYIQVDTEDIELIGNVVVYDDTSRLTADRSYYVKSKDLLKLYGEDRDFVYRSEGRRFSSDYGEYYNNRNLLLIPNKFYFTSVDDEGKKMDGHGVNLTFDTETESGSADNPVVNQENNMLKAIKGIFDFKRAYHYLKGDVSGKYGEYDIETKDVEVDEANELVYINHDYEAINSVDGSKLYGKRALIDNKETKIKSDARSYIEQDGLYAYGDNLDYDYTSEEGSLVGDVYAYNSEDDFTLYGNRAQFKKGAYANFYDKVELEHGEYKSETEELYYDVNSEKATFPMENYMWSNIRDLEGKTARGTYSVKDKVFEGEEYFGRSELSESTSDYIKYFVEEERAILTGDVVVEDRETEMIIETEELYYYRATDYAVAPGEVDIKRHNVLLEAASGNASLRDKTMELTDALLTTTNGDRVSGDKMYADYYKNEFDFAGNIDGKVYTVNQAQLDGIEAVDYENPLRFSGKLAKLYFVEDNEGDLLVTRTEIKDESKFIYKDMILEGDFLEAQGSTQKLFAKGNSVITVQGSNKIGAESITLNMQTEEAYMKNNVTITSTSQETGGINTKADEAFFANTKSTVDLAGNIESYKGQTKFVADKGVFDLENNTLAGEGNIYLSMDFETAEQSDNRTKQEAEDRKKIDAAIKESELTNEIESDTDFIELLRQHEEVIIAWQSSDEEIINLNGDVYHPSYKERDVIVKMTASYIFGETSEKIDYYIRVRKDSSEEYLRNIADRQKPSYNDESAKVDFNYDESMGYTYKVVDIDKAVVDSDGNILLAEDELKEGKFKIIYYIEDKMEERIYSFQVDEDGKIELKVEEEVEADEEHSST